MSNNDNTTGLDTSIEKIKVIMIKDKTNVSSNYSLPDGYTFQYYRKGDRQHWAKIQVKVKHFKNIEAAFYRFDNEFQDYLELLEDRLLFVVDKQGRKIATAMMWFTNISGSTIQRLHWIAVDPLHQGQRIAHAMLKELLSKYCPNDKIYLTTQTWSYKGISIYYKFGFIAFPYEDIDKYLTLTLEEIKKAAFETQKLQKAWNIINSKINER